MWFHSFRENEFPPPPSLHKLSCHVAHWERKGREGERERMSLALTNEQTEK